MLMGLLEELQRKFANQAYEYSLHAVDQSILKRIPRRAVEEAVASGEIIEDYPTDKYGPSCLIFGTTGANRPLHVQCTYPSNVKVKIITVYEPDPDRWIDFRTRRSK